MFGGRSYLVQFSFMHRMTSIYNSGILNDITSLSPVGWWRMGDNDGGTVLLSQTKVAEVTTVH